MQQFSAKPTNDFTLNVFPGIVCNECVSMHLTLHLASPCAVLCWVWHVLCILIIGDIHDCHLRVIVVLCLPRWQQYRCVSYCVVSSQIVFISWFHLITVDGKCDSILKIDTVILPQMRWFCNVNMYSVIAFLII